MTTYMKMNILVLAGPRTPSKLWEPTSHSILYIDKNVVGDIDNLMPDFLWNTGHPLIAKDTLIQPMDLGGLKMVSVFDVFKTTKIMWIKRLRKSINAKWETLSYYLMDIKKELSFSKLYFSTVESCPKSNFTKVYCRFGLVLSKLNW